MSCPKAENAKSCEIRFKKNISASEAELHVTVHQIVLFEPQDGIFKKTAPHLAKIIRNVSRITRTTPNVLKYCIRLYYIPMPMPQSGPPPQTNKGELCLSVLFLLPVTKFHAYTHPWRKNLQGVSGGFIIMLVSTGKKILCLSTPRSNCQFGV